MEKQVPDDSHPFEDVWQQANDVLEDVRKEIRVLLLSAAFRGVQSRGEKLLFLRCQPLKVPNAVIATQFNLSASAVYRAIRKHEKANNDPQSPSLIALEKPVPNMALNPTGEHTLMAWIASRQRNCDRPSARDVQGQASLLFRVRTKQGKHLFH